MKIYTANWSILNPFIIHFDQIGTEGFKANEKWLCNERKKRRNEKLRTILNEGGNFVIDSWTEWAHFTFLNTNMRFEGNWWFIQWRRRKWLDIHKNRSPHTFNYHLHLLTNYLNNNGIHTATHITQLSLWMNNDSYHTSTSQERNNTSSKWYERTYRNLLCGWLSHSLHKRWIPTLPSSQSAEQTLISPSLTNSHIH